MSIFKDFGEASRRNAAPVTTAILVLMIAALVLYWVRLTAVLAPLGFISSPQLTLARPWTFFTYWLVPDPGPYGLLSMLFGCLWLWSIGGTVERELGSLRFAIIWLVFAGLPAAFVLLGAAMLHVLVPIYSPWIPLSMITVMWGTRNPDVMVTFLFVLPLTGKWMAWLSVAFVLFGTPYEVAPFAAIPAILAYYFAANKLPFVAYARGDSAYSGASKKWERYDKSYYEEVQRREKDREERDRLRKLFEGSMQDDSESDK